MSEVPFTGEPAQRVSTAVPSTGVPFRREIELDFLRGIAILLVVDYHSKAPVISGLFRSLSMPPGVLGVYMFFVLSGFLVGGLLMKEWKVRGSVDGGRFLIRRMFKLWPQYYIFLFLSMAAGSFTLRAAIPNLLHLQNYLPGGLSHTWSLAVEEHVYLFLTALFVLAAKSGARIRTVFSVLAGLCFLVAVNRYVVTALGGTLDGRTHLSMDGILYGVMIAMVYHFAPERFGALRARRGLWLCGAVGSFVLMQLARGGGRWQPAFQQNCVDVFAVSMLMLLYHQPHTGRPRNVVYRCVAWIGLYSYGIYLWHINVIRPVMQLSQRLPHVPGPVTGVIVIGCAILVGFVTTEVIEFPMLRLRERLIPKRVDAPVDVSELEPVKA